MRGHGNSYGFACLGVTLIECMPVLKASSMVCWVRFDGLRDASAVVLAVFLCPDYHACVGRTISATGLVVAITSGLDVRQPYGQQC